MCRMKDAYLEELDQIQADLEEEGYSETEAYALAAQRAHGSWITRIADSAFDIEERS